MNITQVSSSALIIEWEIFQNFINSGLDNVPSILLDTMLPNVNPETAAKKSVILNKGYDPCQYSVSLHGFYSQFPSNVYKVSIPPFVSLRVRAKFHSGRNSKHGGPETL